MPHKCKVCGADTDVLIMGDGYYCPDHSPVPLEIEQVREWGLSQSVWVAGRGFVHKAWLAFFEWRDQETEKYDAPRY